MMLLHKQNITQDNREKYETIGSHDAQSAHPASDALVAVPTP